MADEPQDQNASMDMSARLRTWRVFLSWIRWLAVGASVLLALLLVFCTRG